MNKLSLYDLCDSKDKRISKDKLFLESVFLISFDDIREDLIKEKALRNNIHFIDALFNIVQRRCRGYSIDFLKSVTYKKYSNLSLKYNTQTISACNRQMKLYLVIATLYTLNLSTNTIYLEFVNVAKKYASKKYITLNESASDKNYGFDGYTGSDTASANKLRNAFDRYYSKATDEQNKSLNCLFSTQVVKTEKKQKNKQRYVNAFLNEFTYDLIINCMSDGFDICKRLDALIRNKEDQNSFRREAKKFVKGLYIINKNFRPLSNNTAQNNNSLDLLYYYKKENLFHTTLINYILRNRENVFENNLSYLLEMPVVPDITPFLKLLLNGHTTSLNDEFLLNYLTEITFPIYASTFFLLLCEYFDFNKEQIIGILSDYLQNMKSQYVCPETDILFQNVERETATILGEALIDTYTSNKCLFSKWDHSFRITINNIGPHNPELPYLQSDISLAYYKFIME